MPQYNKASATYVDRNNDIFEVMMMSDAAGNIVNPGLTEDTLFKENPSLGYKIINKFGRMSTINTTDVPSDIWEHGGLYSGQPTTGTAEAITVTSSDILDVGLSIEIHGLDINYGEITETVTLTNVGGIATAVTTATFWRSYRAYITTVPVGNTSNVGTLTATMTTTTANIFWTIPIGVGQSTVAAFTIPAGYTGRIKKYRSELLDGNANTAVVAFTVRRFGEGVRQVQPESVNNTSGLKVDLYGSIDLPEKTDLTMRVIRLVNNGGDITGLFDLLLSPNAV